jgi:PAS domain S-box-containing protein
MVRMVALLLLMTVCGVLAVHGAPPGGRAMGIWPVGLASGALVYSRGRHVPALTVLVLVAAVLTIRLGGRPLDVSVGYGIGIAVETWVVWRIFTGGRAEQPLLQTDRDLLRLVTAVGAGGLVIAAVSLLTSVVTGFGNPPLVALTIATANVASQLTLLPFLSHVHQHPPVAPTWERVAQWVLIAVVTPLVFYPSEFPSLVFLAIPLLGWGALRNRPWESLVQLMAVLGFAVVMTTYGLGPFSSISKDLDLPVDVRGTVLGTYAVACALVVVPLIITVGQQLENAHEAAAERDKVQNIVNSATGIAIIGTDETGKITLFNPGAQRLLGYARDEALGRTTHFLHSAEGIAVQAQEMGVANDFATVALAMATPASAGRDMKFRTKDGEERTHSMTLTRMVDDRGLVTGYVSTSEDVTERVRAQAALEEALETERRAVERLQSVDQVKDAFVSSVSHELRTPITSIVGYLEMLSEGSFGDLNTHQADAVRRVSHNSSRLLALIDDLLTLSRVQEDGMTLADRAFDLREVVRSGYGVVSPAWASRDLTVSAELPDEPVPFVGDKDMIERVVVNLVGNAVKFTPDGGDIGVRMTTDGDHAVIDVRDSGIGIPKEEQDQLFSRFFRSSVAQKHAIPGSGLGLSISKAVVEKHGGTIAVTSSSERGTTFRVRLPIVV